MRLQEARTPRRLEYDDTAGGGLLGRSAVAGVAEVVASDAKALKVGQEQLRRQGDTSIAASEIREMAQARYAEKMREGQISGDFVLDAPDCAISVSSIRVPGFGYRCTTTIVRHATTTAQGSRVEAIEVISPDGNSEALICVTTYPRHGEQTPPVVETTALSNDYAAREPGGPELPARAVALV